MKLDELHPSDHGKYVLIDCPECGHHEAYIYKDDLIKAQNDPKHPIVYRCNRQNNCGVIGTLQGVSSLKRLPVDVMNAKETCDISPQMMDTIQNKHTDSYAWQQALQGKNLRGISAETLAENHVIFHKEGFLDLVPKNGNDWKRFNKKIYQNRDVLFPIRDKNNRVVRLLLRSLQPQEKKEIQMKLRSGTQTEIWNLKDAYTCHLDFLFLCEGCYDALSVKEAAKQLGYARGIVGAISFPGCRKIKKTINEVVNEETKTFHNRVYVLATDNDEAGKAALKTGFLSLTAKKQEVKVFPLRGHKDLNEFWINDPEGFKEELRKIVVPSDSEENWEDLLPF